MGFILNLNKGVLTTNNNRCTVAEFCHNDSVSSSLQYPTGWFPPLTSSDNPFLNLHGKKEKRWKMKSLSSSAYPCQGLHHRFRCRPVPDKQIFFCSGRIYQSPVRTARFSKKFTPKYDTARYLVCFTFDEQSLFLLRSNNFLRYGGFLRSFICWFTSKENNFIPFKIFFLICIQWDDKAFRILEDTSSISNVQNVVLLMLF